MEANATLNDFYNRIAQDSKQALIQLISEAGHGKALALDTPIPTVDGWKNIGEIEIGDIVFDENGKPCKVIITSPIRYDHDVYEVEFDDGSKIVADAEHLWITSTRNSRLAQWRRENTKWDSRIPFETVKNTEEIKNTLRVQQKQATNHAVRVSKPLELEEKTLPILPYVLGAWLGDGTSSGGVITIADEEILAQIKKLGYTLKKQNVSDKTKTSTYNVGGLYRKLRLNNLLKNKHIPKEYLRASYEQRLELLRGLMDTDGTVSKDHNSVFCVTNEKLAQDVSELIHTFGIKHKFIIHDAKLYGRFISKRYRFRFCTELNLFYIKRKQKRVPTKTRSTRDFRYIVNVKKVQSVPVKCIGVDSPSHLFLAGKAMIPTHNTSSLRSIIQHVKDTETDIEFVILDVSQAWYNNAPVKYRQLITRDKIQQGLVDYTVTDCVYEMGSLSDEAKRIFVGSLIKYHQDQRYNAKLQGRLDEFKHLIIVSEEANIYFGSYSFRRSDEYSGVFQNYVSVGRNYKMRGFLVATAEMGEMAPSLRERSRKIYGRVISQRDLNVIKRSYKELAEYLKGSPKYTFVYISDKPYGPVKIPDSVSNEPVDYVVYTPNVDYADMKPKTVNKWKWFLYGILSVFGFVIMVFIMAVIAFSNSGVRF